MIIKGLVSVILPVYNAEKYIYDAISSILNQSFKNFELLIINDGSTDGSLKIIEQFNDDRITLINNETNLQLINTLNKGIALSKGEYIARMDADDICHIDRLKKQVAFMESNPDYILCGSWANIIDLDGSKKGTIKRIDQHDLLKVNMLFTTPFIHPTVLLRSNVFTKERYSLDALHCEDLELWMRISEKYGGKFYNIPEYLLNYRIHNSNISVEHSEFQKNHRKNIIRSFVEGFVGSVTENELALHFLLFESPEVISSTTFKELKMWIRKLLATNSRTGVYSQLALKSLLLSRWLLLCVKTRNFKLLFSSGIGAWNFNVLKGVIRLLRYKS